MKHNNNIIIIKKLHVYLVLSKYIACKLLINLSDKNYLLLLLVHNYSIK